MSLNDPFPNGSIAGKAFDCRPANSEVRVRFEVRKQLVLEEANAIGTAHLRTQLIPEAEGKEIAELLRAYTPPTDAEIEAS